MKIKLLFLTFFFLCAQFGRGVERTYVTRGDSVYVSQSANATITFAATLPEGKKIFFQPESEQGYTEVKSGETLEINLTEPAYYYYVDTRSGFHTVFLTPASDTRILEVDGKVTFEGDHAAINSYMQQHPCIVKVPQDIIPYSAEWLKFQRKVLKESIEKLQASGLQPEFVRMHTLYYTCSYQMQLINGPETTRMFSGKTPQLPAGFYNDLKKNSYENDLILRYPKWFNLMKGDMELREKQGDIAIDHHNFLSLYAERIADEKVRAAFLTCYLEQMLSTGYAEDFVLYLRQARQVVPRSNAVFTTRMDEMERQYTEMRQKLVKMTRGSQMPAFTGVDINGKEYSSKAYEGKVWVLDFWFSGCIPCKAEMPYMEQLARDFKDDNIQFFALSLDTGNQLLKAWKTLAAEKQEGPTLQLNIPQGFKSELATHFGIRSVPRIIIVDSKGKVVDAFARRPSDPKLRQLLRELIDGYSEPTLTKADATKALMEVSQAETINRKEEIMNAFLERMKHDKATFAYPMVNMMLSLVVEALYLDGQAEKADTYIDRLPEGEFKRDVVFMSGAKCLENNRLSLAERLMGEAAQMTMKLNEGKVLPPQEAQKYPIMFGMYAEALIQNGKVSEAIPYVQLTCKYSPTRDFKLNRSLATVLMYEKKYKEALPVLETLTREGKADEGCLVWLKEAYIAQGGSEHGFLQYLENLKSTAADRLRSKLSSMIVKEPAPLFTLKNLEGETVSLQDLKGKVVVLDFWATWCGPCKASFPAMQKAINLFESDKDVIFLFINTLENKKGLVDIVKKYMDDHRYSFNVLFDVQDAATRRHPVIESYGAKGIPAKYVIDREGNIRFKLTGFSGSEEETVEELKTMIDMLR